MFTLAGNVIFWLLSLLSIYLINITTLAQPNNYVAHFCENNATYTVNSTYHKNLNTTLSTLLTTNNDFGFYNLSTGQGNDRVNAAALCRGDINLFTCQSCVTDSIVDLRQRCPNQKQAVIYSDYCLLKYSNEAVLGITGFKFSVYLANSENTTDTDRFYGGLRPLLSKLRSDAAAGGPLQKFASGNTSVTGLPMIHALVQCTPDLLEPQCFDCLQDAMRFITKLLDQKVGGRILLQMCNFRYESYRFFNVSTLVNPPSPPPRPPPILQPSPPVSQPSPLQGGRFAKWTLKLVIGGGSALLAFVIIFIMFCILKSPSSNCVASLKHKTEADKNIEAFVLQYGALNMERYQYKDIKKMTNSFKVKLGQGGFGQVFKGKLSNGRLVAVKLLNSSKENGQEFINEVASIGRTSHVNIVTLLGFCFEHKKRALVYEYMPNGSLEKYIHNHVPLKTCDQHIGVTKLYEIALGIACGLDYLHRGCNTRILHLDIKPHNILLDEDFCPKIADFGLAKLYSRKESIVSMLEARGTIGYIAPEVYNKNFGGVSHKSDVYSYGMLLLEIVGGKKILTLMSVQAEQVRYIFLTGSTTVFRRMTSY